MPRRASFAEAAGPVIAGGTVYEGLVDRGRLQAGETVLITAAAGGAGAQGFGRGPVRGPVRQIIPAP
jgi:NADPH:quinone reductase-like Zn-dependent oxidoreductase